MIPAQLAAAHIEPTSRLRHAPAPSQVPSVPHGLPASGAQSSLASRPAGTALQAPILPATAHDWQTPAHAPSQHTPVASAALSRAQCPLLHAASTVQEAPLSSIGRQAGGSQ